MKDYKTDLSKKQISLLEKATKSEISCFIKFLESDCQDIHAFDELAKPSTKKHTVKALYDLHSSGITLKNIETYIDQLKSTIYETIEEEDPWLFHQEPPIEERFQGEKMLNHEHLEWTTNLLEDVAALDLQRLIKRRLDKQQSLSKGYITSKQKDKDWPAIRQSMIDEGFSEKEIQEFYKRHYKATKKKRRTTRKKKTKK